MYRSLISLQHFIIVVVVVLLFFPFPSVSALVQNVTVDALGNTDHSDFQTNGSPQYLPSTSDWSFSSRSNNAQAISVRTDIRNATVVLTTAQPATAFFWRGYLPGTAARYSVCIDCSTIDQLGDIVTLTSEDTTTDGNRSSPVILFASNVLANTTHTIALRNLLNPIEGIVGQLIVDAFIFTADVSPLSTGSNNGGSTSRALMAAIIAITIIIGLCLVFAALFWLLWRRRGGLRLRIRSKPQASILPTTPVSPSGVVVGGFNNDARTSDPLVPQSSSRSLGGLGGLGATLASVGHSIARSVTPAPKSLWKQIVKRKRGESESRPMIERDWSKEEAKQPDDVQLELPIHAKLARAHRSLSLSRFRAPPRFPSSKEESSNSSPNPNDLEPITSSSSFSRLAGSFYRKKQAKTLKSRSSMVSTSSVTIPPPPLPPLRIRILNATRTSLPQQPLPAITVTSPTTVPTSASTYSTFSQNTHDLSRRSDPYAVYAAIYAPYYAADNEGEGLGRRGSRKSRSVSTTADDSMNQLSQKYRSGSALRDSVVLPGLLEMPRQEQQEDRGLVSTSSRSMTNPALSLPTPAPSPSPSPTPASSRPNMVANTNSARAPPSSFNSRVLRMGATQQEPDRGNDGNGGGGEGIRAGAKGKRTLSDKIKRGTLPLIPFQSGGEPQPQQQQEPEMEEDEKKQRRDSFSGSSKRSSTSSILSFASRNSSSVSLVSKRPSTTKNNNNGATTSKRRSSVLRKRRPPSSSSRGGSRESVDGARSNGNENGDGGGDEKVVTSLMPTFSSLSSLSLSSHLLLDGGLSQGGQRRQPTTAQSQLQRQYSSQFQNDSNSSPVSNLIPRMRSEPSLPSDEPLQQLHKKSRSTNDNMALMGTRKGETHNQEILSPSTDSAPLLPTSLSLQSPPVPVNGDSSSSLLPKETTSFSSLLPEGVISPSSPPSNEKQDQGLSYDARQGPTLINETEVILPYLPGDSSLPAEEEAQPELLQVASHDHSHSSVFMSMLTLQSTTDSSTNQSDSHSHARGRPHSAANARMSMKTPRSSLVSKTARSSMMSNGPTPSVSEFPMPPFLTADSAASAMPSFDLYRSNTVNTIQSHLMSSGMTTNSNSNMDTASGGEMWSGTGSGTITDLVASTPSSSSGSFRKSIPIRFAGGTTGSMSSGITGVRPTPPSAFPFAYRPPPRPKRNRALGAALLSLDVPASVQSRAPILRRNSSRSSKGVGAHKAPRRRDKLPFRGDPIPTRSNRGNNGLSSSDQENVSAGTSSTSFFLPPPPSSNDHESLLEQPSRGPSRLTMASAITSTTDEEYVNGDVQLFVARREYPPGIPDVPTRAIAPATEDSLSVDEPRPISGLTTESKWEIMFPGLPPGMSPIITSDRSDSHRSGGPPNAAVPVSARTDAFERATVEMSPKLNRLDISLSRNPSFGATSVGNMRLDATAGLPWSPNFDWPASPTFTTFSNRQPSLPVSSSGFLATNMQETAGRESEAKDKNAFSSIRNQTDTAAAISGLGAIQPKSSNMPSASLQSLSWKDLMGPHSGPQVDPIDTANRSGIRQSTHSVASTFFGGGERPQMDETASPLSTSSPLTVVPPVPPLPAHLSRSSALVDSSPRRTVAPLNLNFKSSWNVRTLSPHSPSSSPQQQQPPRASRAIGTLNDVFATSWNSGSTRYSSSGPGATRPLITRTSELGSHSEQGTPVRPFPQRGVPFP